MKRFGDEYSGTERDAFKQGLADGVFLLGNPQLRTDQTQSNSFTEIYGGGQEIFVTGGISQVPQPIRDVLTSPAASKSHVAAPDGGTHSGGHRSVTDLKTFGGLKTVMDILEHRSVDSNGSVYGSESVQLVATSTEPWLRERERSRRQDVANTSRTLGISTTTTYRRRMQKVF